MLQASGDHDCDHDLGECSTTDFSSREALGEDLMDCHLWGRFTHLIATPQLSAYHLASPGGPWSSRSHLSEMESFGSPIPVESECVSVCVCVLSCVQLFVTVWTVAARLLCPWDFPGKNTGVGCHFLFQGIFPTPGWNPHLLQLLLWRADALPVCHLGRPR